MIPALVFLFGSKPSTQYCSVRKHREHILSMRRAQKHTCVPAARSPPPARRWSSERPWVLAPWRYPSQSWRVPRSHARKWGPSTEVRAGLFGRGVSRSAAMLRIAGRRVGATETSVLRCGSDPRKYVQFYSTLFTCTNILPAYPCLMKAAELMWPPSTRDMR